MTCRKVEMPDGGIAIVCDRTKKSSGRVRDRYRCKDCNFQKPAEVLCDYPVGKNKTCDRPCCEKHHKNISPGVDHCLHHKQQELF